MSESGITEWNRRNIERAIRFAERGSHGNVAAMIIAGIEAAADRPPTDGPKQATMTVMVSPELVKQLTDWSGPVQIKITEIPYRPSAGTHMIEVRPVPDNADSACEGEAAGICSGGPAHHPDCSSAQAVPRMAMEGPARKLIGPPYAHLDAPCTDACYEPEQ